MQYIMKACLHLYCCQVHFCSEIYSLPMVQKPGQVNFPTFFFPQVTLVHNLEYYGIDPAEFAHKLQLKAASSTAGK